MNHRILVNDLRTFNESTQNQFTSHDIEVRTLLRVNTLLQIFNLLRVSHLLIDLSATPAKTLHQQPHGHALTHSHTAHLSKFNAIASMIIK